MPWHELELGPFVAQGTSGRVHAALWREAASSPPRAVALKLVKGAMTSDGLPGNEMAACIAAGGHPQLVGALGRIGGHPEAAEGLLMPLLPEGWRALAEPPSLESCTRDVYEPGLRTPAAAARRIARGIAGALAHLHGRDVLHGDLYAHNILSDGATGAAVLSDFGAAALLRPGPDEELKRIELRAFGLLLGELLELAGNEADQLAVLREVQRACVQSNPGQRPSMEEVARLLD